MYPEQLTKFSEFIEYDFFACEPQTYNINFTQLIGLTHVHVQLLISSSTILSELQCSSDISESAYK